MADSFLQCLKVAVKSAGFEKSVLDDLCRCPRDIPAKKSIIRAGDEVTSFPVLLSGWAISYEIMRDGSRQITRLLLPGDALFFKPTQDLVSIQELITLSPCRIINISHAEMGRMIERYPAVGEAIHNYGCIENAILASWVVNIGRRDALERMAHFICETHYRLSKIGEVKSEQFFFPLTQDDLADVLGLTPVHINRKLQQLRQEELITLRSKQMTILDLRKLQQVAGFDHTYLTSLNALPDDRAVRSIAI